MMYSQEEMALMPPDLETHAVTVGTREIAQALGILADQDVVLVAAPGELPQIAYEEGKL
jgi:hypothetical protein